MSQEGKPIWAELVLSAPEWKEQARRYPSVYNRDTPPAEFDCEFKWRKGMGSTLPPLEIKTINERLTLVLKKAGLLKQEHV